MQLQARIQDQTARRAGIYVRMELHQIVAARGGSISVRNHRAKFFQGIDAAGGAYTQTVHGYCFVRQHQHGIVRHILEHDSTSGPQSVQGIGGGRLVELHDHVGRSEPRQAGAADDRIFTRKSRTGVSWRMNFEAQRRLSEQKGVRKQKN